MKQTNKHEIPYSWSSSTAIPFMMNLEVPLSDLIPSGLPYLYSIEGSVHRMGAWKERRATHEGLNEAGC